DLVRGGDCPHFPKNTVLLPKVVDEPRMPCVRPAGQCNQHESERVQGTDHSESNIIPDRIPCPPGLPPTERDRISGHYAMKLVRAKDNSNGRKTPLVQPRDQSNQGAGLVKEPHLPTATIAAGLGLRASEVFALQWCDVDWNDMTLMVQRSVMHGKVECQVEP